MEKDKKHSFKTPEGYFDNFHDRLMDKINQQEGEQETSIIPKSDGFAVPDGYFDGLTEKVTSKIDQKEQKVIKLKFDKKFYYSAAAVAAILLLFFGLNWENSTEKITFEDLAAAEINAYFESTTLDLNTYELAEAFETNDLNLNDIFENEFEEESIWEYLDENVEDLQDLNIQYNDYE